MHLTTRCLRKRSNIFLCYVFYGADSTLVSNIILVYVQGYHRVISVKAKERKIDVIHDTIIGDRAKVHVQLSLWYLPLTTGGCLKSNLNESKPSEHPIKAFIRWEHRLPGQDLLVAFNRVPGGGSTGSTA